MKILPIVVAVFFVIFAIAQLNDSDPYLWVAIYSWVAVCFVLLAFGRLIRPLVVGGIVVCSIYFLYLLPDFIDWIKMGMPSITATMQAETPHVELVREFLGLGLCISAFVYLLRRT